jgi:hypothetical protein
MDQILQAAGPTLPFGDGAIYAKQIVAGDGIIASHRKTYSLDAAPHRFFMPRLDSQLNAQLLCLRFCSWRL